MKAVVAALNQEKALVGAFSVIVKTDGSFAALVQCLVWCVGCILVDCISRLHKNISTYFVFCEKKVVLQLLAT